MIKRALYIALALTSALLLALVIIHYHSDMPLEELKARYTYPDSRFVEVQG